MRAIALCALISILLSPPARAQQHPNLERGMAPGKSYQGFEPTP